MAKKKINQMPKAKDQFTGSYVQNLVGNKPVTPVAQVQASAVNPAAVGGNNYQSYVNGGAAVTPTAASAVTPGVTVNALRGQYAANLGTNQPVAAPVVQKKSTAPAINYSNVLKDDAGGGFPTVNEVGGSSDGAGGEGNGKVVVEQYGPWLTEQKAKEESIVEQYDEAKKYAEETKEGAYKSAEDNYNIAVRDANANFRTNQPTYGLQAERLLASGLTGSGYSDYLAGKAYEARSDEINAARSQRSYAEQLADQNYQQMMYQAGTDKRNAEGALSDWKMNYQVQLDAEYKAKVDEVLTGVLNGDYSAEVAETKLKNYAPGGVISQDILDALKEQEEKYWWYNNSSVTGDYLSFMQAQIAEGNIVNKDTMRQWLKSSTNLDDDTIEFWVNSFTDENGNVDKGKVDDAVNGQSQNSGNTGNTGNSGSTGTSTEESKNRWSGDEAITRGNARFKNDAMGSRTDLGDGDNFNITVNGKTYRVESGGELKDKTVLAALKDAGIEDGEVFSYGDQAFLKKNGKYYEIDTRVFRPNAEGNLVQEINNNKSAGQNMSDKFTTYMTEFKNDKLNSRSYKPGNTIKLKKANGDNYKLKVDAVINENSEIYRTASEWGLKNGEAFIYGEDLYVFGGNKVYMIREDKKNYNDLYNSVKNKGTSSDTVKATSTKATAQLMGDKKIGAEIQISRDGNYVGSATIAKIHGSDSYVYKKAQKANLKENQTFWIGDKLFIYLGDECAELQVSANQSSSVFPALAD